MAVQGSFGGGTTTYRYYTFNGQRIGMRKGTVLQYLLGDHLGSTSLVLNGSGVRVAESRYYPYGEERWSSGTLPTDYRFTGQRDVGLGLYHMGARFYDSYLARWISADTLVPDVANPQHFNRYSYVGGNPLRYTDPTGRFEEDQIRDALGDTLTDDEVNELIEMWQAYYADWWALLMKAQFGDMLDGIMTNGIEHDVRKIAEFYQGDDGRLKLRSFHCSNGTHLGMNGKELIDSGEATFISDHVSLWHWFGTGTIRGEGEDHVTDIILLRQHQDGGGYYPSKGTGIYFDPAGGIRNPKPKASDLLFGPLRVAAGLAFIVSGVITMAADGPLPVTDAFGLGQAAVGATWGIYGGVDQTTNYGRAQTARTRLNSYR